METNSPPRENEMLRFNLAELPWWGQFIYVVGVPSALVIFLTWFITGALTQRIDSILLSQQKLNEAYSAHNLDSSYNAMEITNIKLIMQQICVNSAINANTSRVECYK